MTATARFDPRLEGRIVVDVSYRDKDRAKAVPGARWSTEHRIWSVPQSWTACLALRSEFGSDLVIDPEVRAWATPISKIKDSLRRGRTTIDYELPADILELPGMADLYPHQRVDAVAIRFAERYLLMNDTGLGKTRSALAGLSYIQATTGDAFPVLVTAPLSMLRTWEDEIAGFFPDATISVVTGTPSKMRKALEPGADFYVICWDSLRKYTRLVGHPQAKLTDLEREEHELNALGIRTLVADECHRVKNVAAKRSRAAYYLSERCKYVIGLTGTPMQDTPEDLYGALHMVAPHEYPTKTSFLDRYVEYEWNVWGGKDVKGIRQDRLDEWQSNFDARSRRMTKEMVLDFLPPKIETVRWVELPPKHRKAYDTLENNYMATLEDSVMAVDNQLVLAGRLLQLANALGDMVTDDEGNEHFVMSGDSSPKVDAFVDDYLEGDFAGEQIVVFADSRQLIELVGAALKKHKVPYVEIHGGVTGDERKAAMDAFQAGEFPICLLTRAGGEGITLTAASTMVRLVRSWSSTVHKQVQDRVHRIGSERHEVIRYVDYVTEDTIEMGQMARLAEKERRSQETLRDGELLEILKEKKARGKR